MFSRLIKKILRDRAISLCVDMQVYRISEQRNINSLKVKTVRKIITIDIHQTEYEWGRGGGGGVRPVATISSTYE